MATETAQDQQTFVKLVEEMSGSISAARQSVKKMANE
jgi:hypothetical protein